MSNEPESKKNVVNLAEARKKQRTVRAGANGKAKETDKGKRGPAWKIFGYVQVLLFLAIVAYMMTLCQGKGGG